MPSDSERFVVCEVCKLEAKFCKCEQAMTPTDRDQQDREAFQKWMNSTYPVSPMFSQCWQAALAYERGKSGWQLNWPYPIYGKSLPSPPATQPQESE